MDNTDIGLLIASFAVIGMIVGIGLTNMADCRLPFFTNPNYSTCHPTQTINTSNLISSQNMTAISPKMTIFLGHNISSEGWTVSLNDLSYPNSNGDSSAYIVVYKNGEATNVTYLAQNSTGVFTVNNETLYVTVYKIFPGLYAYQKWAQMRLYVKNGTETNTIDATYGQVQLNGTYVAAGTTIRVVKAKPNGIVGYIILQFPKTNSNLSAQDNQWPNWTCNKSCINWGPVPGWTSIKANSSNGSIENCKIYPAKNLSVAQIDYENKYLVGYVILNCT